MSSIEERFARDIAAVTGGIIVTESDLREARRNLDERIESSNRRGRIRVVAGAAAAAVVLAGAVATAFLALGGDEDTAGFADRSGVDPDAGYLTGGPPTPELVEGVWRLDNGAITLKFDADGDVRFDDHGTLFSQPATTGTYAIEGDVISVTTTTAPRTECTGITFRVRASSPEPGILRFVRSDPANTCPQILPGRGALEKALPTSPVMAGLVFSQDTGWQPVSGTDTLLGVWLAEGGGHLLEMDADGSYYIADDSAEPIDQGRWSLRGADLTLTSSAQSVACEANDRLTLVGMQWVNPGTIALRGTLRENTCGGAWTPATWILLPRSSNAS